MWLIYQLKKKLIHYVLSHSGNIVVYPNATICRHRFLHALEVDKILQTADFIARYRQLGIALLAYLKGDIDKATYKMHNDYQGAFKNTVEFTAWHTARIDPKLCPLEAYIDYEKFDKDLFKDEFFALEAKGKVHVFRSDD